MVRRYAVRHRVGKTTAFPRASVSKRIETNEPECFRNLRVMVLDLLQQYSEDEKN